MINIPDWTAPYMNDYDSTNIEVKNFYKKLKTQWNKGEYVKISDFEGENSSYYFYYLWDQILKPFHKTPTLKTFKRVNNRIKKFVINYQQEYKSACLYAILWGINMAQIVSDEETIVYWKMFYLNHINLWKEPGYKGIGNYEYYDANIYAPVELFSNFFSISSLLTSFSKPFIDEIYTICERKLKEDFEKTHINFLHKFLDFEERSLKLETGTYTGENEFYITTKIVSQTQATREFQSKVKKTLFKQFIRDAENDLRDSLILPKVNEGWVSETILFKQIAEVFSETSAYQHFKPNFLKLQHYDIYLPKYKIAIEYQGLQHTQPVEMFGGEEGFKNNQERDYRKKQLSKANNVTLIEVFPNYNIDEVVENIISFIKDENVVTRIESLNLKGILDNIAEKPREKSKNFYKFKQSINKNELSSKDKEKYQLLLLNKEKSPAEYADYLAFVFDKSNKLGLTHEEIMLLIEKVKQYVYDYWDFNKFFQFEERRSLLSLKSRKVNEYIYDDTKGSAFIGSSFYYSYFNKDKPEYKIIESTYDLKIVSEDNFLSIKRQSQQALQTLNELNKLIPDAYRPRSNCEGILFRAFLCLTRNKAYNEAIFLAKFAISQELSARGKKSYKDRIRKIEEEMKKKRENLQKNILETDRM